MEKYPLVVIPKEQNISNLYHVTLRFAFQDPKACT